MFAKRKFTVVLILVAVLISSIVSYLLFNKYIKTHKAFYEFSTHRGPFCGLVSVATICSLKGIETNISTVYRHAGVQNEGTSLAHCQRALEELGVLYKAIRFKAAKNLPEGVPILCTLRAKKGLHAVVIFRRADNVLVIDGQRTLRKSTDWLDSVTVNLALVPR